MLDDYYSILNVIGSPNVVAIVNPLSGAGANPDVAARRIALLESRFRAASIDGVVHVTRHGGHARALAAAAVADGASLVVAWGGDGTINEVADVLSGTRVSLGIVPAGSGNGFAHELGVSDAPAAAIETALHGQDRLVDVGAIDGRSFVNIAGIGVDAVIAQQFNARAQGQRGMWPYVRIGLAQAWRYRGERYRVTLDDESLESDALLIAFANGREYGNKLRLAAHARLDDGKLEAVVVADRRPLARLWSGRHLALGTTHRASGVMFRSVGRAEIHADRPILYHVDGEPALGGCSVTVSIRPGALRVRVPGGGGEHV
jgi:YegS/Rv2252/BmrU family lipid kinase